MVAGMLAIGCGKESPTAPALDPGTFRGTLSGHVSGSRVGTAEFSTSDDNVFAISLTSGTEPNQFRFSVGMPARPDVGRPEVGTLHYDESAFWGGMFLGGDDFFIDGGTVTITASTATMVSGTFNVTCYDSITDETVTFTGSFSARPEGSEFGTFDATYTGATNGSAGGGRAFFAVSAGGDFLLEMQTGANWGHIEIFGDGTGRLGAGSHTVGDGVRTNLRAIVSVDNNTVNDFSSTSGTVNVTASSSTSMQGTFNIDLANGSATLNVTGNFTANCPGARCN